MFRRLLLTFVFCVSVLAITKAVLAAGPEDARQFVDNIGKQVIGIIDSGNADDHKQSELRKMFLANVDVNWMGKFVAGTAWKQATEEQRTRYLQAYQKYMLAHYTSKFSEYTNSKYTITDVQKENDGQFTVNMNITTAGSDQTKAGYRLSHDGKSQFKIVDIIIEGVSLLVTQRSEFTSLVQREGVNGLISALEKKSN